MKKLLAFFYLSLFSFVSLWGQKVELLPLLQSKQWTMTFDRLTLEKMNGEQYRDMNSSTNFFLVDEASFTLQLVTQNAQPVGTRTEEEDRHTNRGKATIYWGNDNGLGGITLKGATKDWKFQQKKSGKIIVRFKIKFNTHSVWIPTTFVVTKNNKAQLSIPNHCRAAGEINLLDKEQITIGNPIPME